MLAGAIGFGLARAHNPSVALQCQISASLPMSRSIPTPAMGPDILRGERILNDETVFVLWEQALNEARAGADVMAPSTVIDGRDPRRTRRGKFEKVQILSYAAKYALPSAPMRHLPATSAPNRLSRLSTKILHERKTHGKPRATKRTSP
jgi:hypothetical protein